MLSAILFICVCALLYRLRRERELLAETLQYYTNLAAGLAAELQNRRDLASRIGHDLKSPLAGIIASAESLEMAGSSLPTTYLECLKLMRDSGRTNLRMLSNFIDLVADKKINNSTQTLLWNRKELFRGLLPADFLSGRNLEWKNCPYEVKIKVASRPFSCAFAELLDIARIEAEKSGSIVEIEESLSEETKELMISLRPIPCPELRSSGVHYQVALKSLERLQIRVVSAETSEMPGYLDIYLPVESFVRLPADPQATTKALKEAEDLLSWSVQQVHSARLSVSALKEEVETEAAEPTAGVTNKLSEMGAR